MNLDVLFWIFLLTLAIIFGSILSLTLFVRSSYSDAMKKVTTGKPQEALDLLLRVIGWQQKHVPALWQLATLYLSTDKIEAAVRYLERIITIMDSEPDKMSAQARWEVTEAQVLSKLAWSLSKLNKRADAIRNFRRLIEFEPKNKEARFELARLLYTTREYDQCIPMFESVIQLDPAYTEAYESMSHAHAAKGNHRKAAEILATRLASDRQNVNLWIRLANLYRTARENDKQAEAWSVVAEITPPQDPNHLSAVVQLGKIAFVEGRYPEAVDRLKQAAESCPPDDVKTRKSIKYYLGLGLSELNRKAESLAALSEVYELDHRYKNVRDLLKGAIELLSDDDLVEEVKQMTIDEFSGLCAKIVEKMGYTPTSIESINNMDVKVQAKLEETGKDRPAMAMFQRDAGIDVGDFAIRNFAVECEEKHVEYPVFLTTGGFSFEAQLRAKDRRLKLMPKNEFCEMVRKIRTAL